ncbi:hypothetical protein HDU98_010337, partial [Podochytrium sp. JEL0797]
YQYPITGVGYNACDIAIDFICTILSIVHTWSLLCSDLSGIAQVIVKENILRSFITVAINVYLLYASWVVADAFALGIGYLMQDLVYAVCLKVECFWFEERKRQHRINSTMQGVSLKNRESKTAKYPSNIQEKELF